MLATLLLVFAAQDPQPAAVEIVRPLAFARQTLSSQFLCEGAAFGDLDGDGDADVVAGPWWYEGPDFTARHPLYPAKQFHRLHYSDNFFAWIRDLDGDGRNDVFVVGFPGEGAYWLRNTGAPDSWEPHVVFQGVDNESPIFADLTGDGRPELICQNQDRLGWLEADWQDPRKQWTFRTALQKGAGAKFTHGLGVGDVDGDGRPDILRKEGWYQQPRDLAGEPAWAFHPVDFARGGHGGAQMLVTDVDGDGRNDVISSHSAHGWGLSWFRQGENGAFEPHAILPPQPAPGNVSELHALCLCDLDGDGLQDVVTGKRWWSHGPSKDRNRDGGNDPAWLLGLLLRREPGGARFAVALLDDNSGVGTQVSAGDVDGDGRADVVVANKRGTFVLRQQAAQDPTTGPDLGFESGTLRGWTATGTAFQGQPVRSDLVAARKEGRHSRHDGEFWIGGYELVGDEATGTLLSDPIPVTKPWASFLIGGGAKNGTRVEVLAADGTTVICAVSGNNEEEMQTVAVDLTAHVGKAIRIRLVDEDKGGWGHVNFDHFQFHDEPVRGLVPNSIGGLEPQAAAAAMTTEPGFQVDLVAAEPQLHQPVALWVDQRNRLWVAEAYSYPVRRPDAEAQDTILVFEDRDGDGSYEHRTVFHDKLNLVSGLAVGFGGVWVGAAPELLFIPDRDSDLVPDGPPEVVLDGWGLEDTHETLNSFLWGPDGWLYGTHGVFTHSKVGRPGTPDDQRVKLNCGVWRFHPTRREFEVFAWGTSNPWGVDFDDRGHAFLACCVIPHLWHMVQGGRYQRQGGRHFDEHAWIEIATIADHAHFVGETRDHAWWGGRERPVTDPGTDQKGGGHAHCGTLLYKGTAFPAEYRNAVLFCNIHGNRVNQDRLERQGSGYVGRHAPDLVKANDPWFRGVALRQGSHGEVFFIDWYDKNACHRTNPQIWDRTNGRLYRLRHGPLAQGSIALDTLADDELAAMQASADDFAVSHARRILQERGRIAPGALAVLRTLLRHDESRVRLRALWALHVTDHLDAQLLLATLQSPDPDLRGWAARLGAEQPQRFPAVMAALPALATAEPEPAVRLDLASCLQRLPAPDRWDLATALLAHAADGQDHNIPTVLWYGVEPLAALDGPRFVALAANARIEPVRRLMWRRAALGEPTLTAALTTQLRLAEAPHQEILRAILAALRDQPGLEPLSGWTACSGELMRHADLAVRDLAADVALAFGDATLAPVFRARLADPQQNDKRRLAALEGLVRLRDPVTGPILLQVLAEPALRRAALHGIAAYDLPEAPGRILALLPELDATDRELALGALTTRPASARAFLQAVAAGQASPRLLDAASLRRQLQALGDPQIEALLQQAWGRSVRPSQSAETDIARYKQLLTPEFLAGADPSHGRAIFTRTCQACHKLYGQGGVLAPDLTGSNRQDLDYLLSNIIDPSAEMSREYQLVTVRLKDGRLLTGNMLKDAPTAVTVKSLAGEITVRRRDLAEDRPGEPAIEYSKESLMPKGQLQLLSDEEVRDLIAYLRTSRQAPIAASPENVGAFFDGVSLRGWDADPKVWRVENGELIGQTATGLPHNDFARSELLVGDFRLTFEVRLTPDTANSGVQFRSQGLPDGEMKGYQADIGKGWWGILYEESGRGVLARPQQDPVRPGEWNRYEITAVGDRIRLAINGVTTVDLVDPPGRKRGVIAPQVHSGGPTEVRFRNFVLELDPK